MGRHVRRDVMVFVALLVGVSAPRAAAATVQSPGGSVELAYETAGVRLHPAATAALQELTGIVGQQLQQTGTDADVAALEAHVRTRLSPGSLAYLEDGFPDSLLPLVNAGQPLGYTVVPDTSVPEEEARKKRRGGWACRGGQCRRVSSLMWWILLVVLILV